MGIASIETKTRFDPKDGRYTEADVPCVIISADDGTYRVLSEAEFRADPIGAEASKVDDGDAKRDWRAGANGDAVAAPRADWCSLGDGCGCTRNRWHAGH